MTSRATLAALLLAASLPLQAASDYFPELSVPLYEYCDKISTSGLLHEELGFLFQACERAHADDEAMSQQQLSPHQYLMSLRHLDKMHHKSLWELHLLLRSAIDGDDVPLFEKLAALEERQIFEMNGLVPEVVAFTQRHGVEFPWFVNPNSGKNGAFAHTR